jgi:hypothetical protein
MALNGSIILGGSIIYNATRGGKLESVPSVDFDSLF